MPSQSGPALPMVMTIAGRVPWLADTLDPDDGFEAFHAYVRQDAVMN